MVGLAVALNLSSSAPDQVGGGLQRVIQ